MTESWLPDFCQRQRVLALLGMAELVVVLVMLAPGGGTWGAGAFLSASAFAMWLAISVSVLLCGCRRFLSRLPLVHGVLVALLLTGVVTAFAAMVVYALYDTLGIPVVADGMGHFTLSSSATAVLITALAIRYFYVSDRWAAQVSANARAEADALQARIRPHFLFNSMNMIASLVRRDPEVAERAVLDLSDLFRAALGAGEGEATLEQEIELVRRYLSIESLRLGERLQIEWDLQEPLPWALTLPRLVFQPLVENAVLHGVSRISEGGTIGIRLAANDGALHLSIENPCPVSVTGMPSPHQGTGHAQKNIAYRLAHMFGSRARLQAGPGGGGRYRCQVSLPLE